MIKLTWNKFLLALVSFLSLFLLLEEVWKVYWLEGYLDRCLIDRFDSNVLPSKWHDHRFSTLLFECTQLSVLILFLFQSFWPSKNELKNSSTSINWGSIFVSSYAIVWYICTYCFCYSFAFLLQDWRCNRRANSVSGHFCYHIFYLLTVSYLTVRLASDPQNFSRYLWSDREGKLVIFSKRTRISTKITILFLVFIFGSSIFTISQTYLFGYHTARQIIYGSLLAVFSHFILISSLYGGRNNKHFLPLLLFALVSVSFPFVYFITGEIPFKTRELIFCASSFLMVCYSYWYPLNGKLKDISDDLTKRK
eukprot:TRINITY_DN6384_c0_g1_i1.p1 TRINITY_DN6384_c0_g1~~TRINITY_DN6384_c0_g1_i1.p1  ORF type:complete len:308 (-),score=41.18 TRINITY_DN6384_c0_g1_i1:4-927(-)